MTEKRKNLLLRSALFSGLGIFACLLMSSYTNLPDEIAGRLSSLWIYLFFVVMFNLLGYLTIRMSVWLNNQYLLNDRRRWRLAIAYVIVMLSTLAVNYALFVAAKLLVESDHPFSFPNGGLRILILVWLVELAILGLLSANKSMQDTLRLQRRTASLQEQNNTARYAALQSQLNPHFLFNSLNTLVAEIEYDPQRAIAFTRNLSDVYRYVLQCQNKRLVPLSEELSFAQAYLYLHEVRLGDCISMKTEVTKNDMESLLPPLTLQLLLENVVKHNSISASRPMEISVVAADGWLTVTNVLRPKNNHTSEMVGLKNLANRCGLALDREIEVRATKDLFIVKIPLLYE